MDAIIFAAIHYYVFTSYISTRVFDLTSVMTHYMIF